MSYGFSPTLMQWRRLQYHKDCFRMLSPPVQYPNEYKFVIEKWPTRFRELVTLTARQLQLTPFLNPQHSFEPNNIGTPKNLTSINIRYHIENEATKCGKTVFIASRKSGVHSRLDQEQSNREYRQRIKSSSEVPQSVKAMAIGGATVTFFLLCVAVAGLSIISFAMECSLKKINMGTSNESGLGTNEIKETIILHLDQRAAFESASWLPPQA
ncbi:Pumilio 6, chloroplastic [Folsomia candida]|uniref:Pumilio 6, chloroplastic n=1 Tax=Folsomia candida TaxID=158441 RepID=A0A226EBV7_FOLCA|nr:Pumilio 6, chloroplastic [Folsomia candida]